MLLIGIAVSLVSIACEKRTEAECVRLAYSAWRPEIGSDSIAYIPFPKLISLGSEPDTVSHVPNRFQAADLTEGVIEEKNLPPTWYPVHDSILIEVPRGLVLSVNYRLRRSDSTVDGTAILGIDRADVIAPVSRVRGDIVECNNAR